MLIVGLGNPGQEYINSRHNIGYTMIEHIAAYYNLKFYNIPKYKSELAKGVFSNQRVIFIKPTTYMNLSGKAVSLVKNFYKLQNHNIIVIHDDLDLAIGTVRLKIGGGDGGHNGLKSITNIIGNEYLRIRIGIGRPPEYHLSVASYVLSDFSLIELETLNPIFKKITENFKLIICQKINEFISTIKN